MAGVAMFGERVEVEMLKEFWQLPKADLGRGLEEAQLRAGMRVEFRQPGPGYMHHFDVLEVMVKLQGGKRIRIRPFEMLVVNDRWQLVDMLCRVEWLPENWNAPDDTGRSLIDRVTDAGAGDVKALQLLRNKQRNEERNAKRRAKGRSAGAGAGVACHV